MRIVLDTNVIIAAFASQGLCHLVFESVISNHSLIVSHHLLNEIEDNLRKKLKLPQNKIKEIVHLLASHSEIGKSTLVSGISCRDSDDLKVLSLAINSNAEAVVTGDQDLLVLKSVFSVKILSPRDFWTLLRKV